MTEREQNALKAIERDLRTTNPELAGALAGGVRSRQWRWQAILVLADVTAALMIVTGFFAGAAGLVVAGLVAMTALVGTPIAVRHQKKTAL